jgi:uncharacterized protein (TIGR03437 family)
LPKFKTPVFAGLIVALSGATLASAQTSSVAHLTVQSGNGQVLCTLPGCTLQSWQPISVKATDSSGNPVAGATVTWTVTGGGITLGGASTATSVTGGNGIATQTPTETIFSNTASPGQSFLINTIQAASNNNSVIFTETQDLINANTPSSEIEANPPQYGGQNLGGTTLVANVGTTLTTPILVQVAGLDIASNGVPNVAVRIVNQQASPTLTCASQGGYADPGSVLTNAQGLATCYPVFSGSGSGTFFITIGGVPSSDITTAQYLQAYPQYSGDLTGYTFTSNPGAPSSFQIVSGNNQVGNIGSPLNPLVAKLVDGGGNPVQGQTVVWTVVPAGAVGLGNGPFVTDNNGQVSISVTLDLLASAGAAITVALKSNPNISVTFQESVQGALTAMNKIGGDKQTAQVGTNFASPIVVQVVSGSGPVANYPVQYLVSGPVTLSATTVGTDNSGTAQVTVKAGSVAGTATVTAVAGALTQVFTLTISSTPAGPVPNGMSIVSGNTQTAVIGTQFAQPLVVQVNSTAGPVANYTVGFSTTGPVSLSTGAATTNSSGQASLFVTAGNAPGAVTVTASISGGFQAIFNLTVSPQGPQISPASFLNAASRQAGQLSPCSLAILTAQGLTPDSGNADYTAGPVFGRWPKSVNHLSVTFGGIPAPIRSVVPSATNPEVTLQVPCEVTPGGSVPVVVNVNGGGTASTNIPITAVSPGIFQQVMSDGTSRAVAMRSDGTFADIGNPDSYDPTNPVRLGEIVRFYLTGLGATTPPIGTDAIENPNAYIYGVDATVNGNVSATFTGSNQAMEIISARQAPGQIGVYEIQVQIPSNAPTGANVPFSISIVPTPGATAVTASSTVPVQ